MCLYLLRWVLCYEPQDPNGKGKVVEHLSNTSASFHTLWETELKVQVSRIRDSMGRGKSTGTSSQG